MTRHLSRSPLMFHRTMGAAFKDATYGCAIERPWPPLWKRLAIAIKEILS